MTERFMRAVISSNGEQEIDISLYDSITGERFRANISAEEGLRLAKDLLVISLRIFNLRESQNKINLFSSIDGGMTLI